MGHMGVADGSAISMRVGSDFVSAPMEENLMMTSSGKLEGEIEKHVDSEKRRPRTDDPDLHSLKEICSIPEPPWLYL
jgi:hypothetical protein